jgi:hypothetical protein
MLSKSVTQWTEGLLMAGLEPREMDGVVAGCVTARREGDRWWAALVAHSISTLAFECRCIRTRFVALLAAYRQRVCLSRARFKARRIDTLDTSPYLRNGPLRRT